MKNLADDPEKAPDLGRVTAAAAALANVKAGPRGPAWGNLQLGRDQSTLKKAAGSAWQTAQGPVGVPSTVLPHSLQT